MKMKKILPIVIASCMVLLTACGEKSNDASDTGKIKEGGTIVFAAGGDPRVLNPMYGNDRVTMTINNAVYSPLFDIENGEKQYYLAESFTPSEDFLTYTLKLKKDLKWHDGEALTADDIVLTLDKILDKSQKSLLRGDLLVDGKPVEYKKVDDLTVEFKMPRVMMNFESALASFSPIPKHIFQGETDIATSTKNENPIGSGPYKFKEHKKGESVTLVKNEDYFGGKPHIDTVVYRIIADANSSTSAFLNGEISAKYVDPRDIDKFQDKATIETYDEGMLVNAIMNFDSPALAKKEVRQAIAYALDKDEIIKAGYIDEKYALKAYSDLVPTTLYYTDDVNKYEKNVEKAKELIAQSGMKDITLNIIFTNGKKSDEATALVMQERLKDIGIDLQIVPMERNAFIQKLFTEGKKDFDMAINAYVMGNEPNAYRSMFETGAENNISNYVNKDLDKKWEAANGETDKDKRKELYKEIQQTLSEDLPIYPITYSQSIIAIDKKIGGVKEAKPAPIFMFKDLSKLYLTE